MYIVEVGNYTVRVLVCSATISHWVVMEMGKLSL